MDHRPSTGINICTWAYYIKARDTSQRTLLLFQTWKTKTGLAFQNVARGDLFLTHLLQEWISNKCALLTQRRTFSFAPHIISGRRTKSMAATGSTKVWSLSMVFDNDYEAAWHRMLHLHLFRSFGESEKTPGRSIPNRWNSAFAKTGSLAEIIAYK